MTRNDWKARSTLNYCTAAGRRPGSSPRLSAGCDALRNFGYRATHRLDVHRVQPRELTFGKLARRSNAAIAQRHLIAVTFEKPPDLAIADAAHRRHVGVERMARAQTAYLVDQ